MITDQAKRIKLLILDVDGVLTAGDLVYSEDGTESKTFDIHDGLGIALTRHTDLTVAVITGRRSACVERRMIELGVRYLIQGSRDKGPAVRSLLAKMGIGREEASFIGDDLNDIPAFREVGLKIAVSDACDDLKRLADHVTERGGGRGAVREVIELVLKSRGAWDDAVQAFLKELERSNAGPDHTAHQ